jgi:magnesium transporter
MSELMESRARKLGLPPGTLVHLGSDNTDPVKLSIIDYSSTQFEERHSVSVDECLPFKDRPSITWINVDGLHQLEIIEKLGKAFNLHPLTLEDIVSTSQRPKIEELDSYLFIVVKMVRQIPGENDPRVEQVSMVVGSNFVLSFQEAVGDVFDPIRDRLRNSKGRIRENGADYLAYCLIDMLVDHYYVVLETLGDRIEEMEDEVINNPSPQAIAEIHDMRRELILLRKSIWPLREVIAAMARIESDLISETTRLYMRDVYDHAVQVVETIEAFRDIVSGMLEMYLTTISNKTNEVMKILTIMATIFIPLTFIAGVYGMNFQHMPELHWKWGYALAWAAMLSVAGVMIAYFRRKKWL